jgi:hypothetical protein
MEIVGRFFLKTGTGPDMFGLPACSVLQAQGLRRSDPTQPLLFGFVCFHAYDQPQLRACESTLKSFLRVAL